MKETETINNSTVSGDCSEISNQHIEKVENHEYTYLRPLSIALKEAANRPPLEYLWFGIPNSPSVTMLVAVAKMGKSIFAENLAYHLASNISSGFLGFSIINDRKVAILSLEEAEINRTDRQKKQLENIDLTDKDHIAENIFVLNSDFYQFLSSDKQRKETIDLMRPIMPDVIIIDSLSRLYMGVIESSEYAQHLMAYVRNLAFTFNVPVIILHHLVKTKNADNVELSTMAGSRIISQECDGVIAITKDESGVRKLKGLAWRYYPENDEDIRYFRIDSNCLIQQVENDSAVWNPINHSKTEMVEAYIKERCTVTTSELMNELVETGKMGRSTLFDTLLKIKKVKSITKGSYSHVDCLTHDFDSWDEITAIDNEEE